MNAAQPTIQLRLSVLDYMRDKRGLTTDQQLAAAMGIHHSNVSRVLAGKQQPGPRFMAALCIALGAPLEDLFTVDSGRKAA